MLIKLKTESWPAPVTPAAIETSSRSARLLDAHKISVFTLSTLERRAIITVSDWTTADESVISLDPECRRRLVSRRCASVSGSGREAFERSCSSQNWSTSAVLDGVAASCLISSPSLVDRKADVFSFPSSWRTFFFSPLSCVLVWFPLPFHFLIFFPAISILDDLGLGDGICGGFIGAGDSAYDFGRKARQHPEPF